MKSIAQAYNADHSSNIMTDCFTQAFFVFVESDDPATLAWRAQYERKHRDRRA